MSAETTQYGVRYHDGVVILGFTGEHDAQHEVDFAARQGDPAWRGAHVVRRTITTGDWEAVVEP